MQLPMGYNLSNVKVSNQSAIREIIYCYGPLSRLEIAERLGLTIPTITTNVKSLLAKNVLVEIKNVDTEVKSLGRQTAMIDTAKDYKYFLGIEFRGSLRRLCITDYKGNLIGSARDDTVYQDYNKCIYATALLVKKLLRSSHFSLQKIGGLGIAVPGLVDTPKGILIMHPKYEWKQKEIAQDISSAIGYTGPVSVENNVCARAYGAHFFHNDILSSAASFIYLFVSSGIACPLFNNTMSGNIIGIGEAGHFKVDPNGPLCSCGKHGCLEAYSAESAVIPACIKAMETGNAQILRQICANPQAPTISEILKAQSSGDKDVNKIVTDAVFYLALTMSNIDNFVRPDSILIECNYFDYQPNRALFLETVYKYLYTATPINTKYYFMPNDTYSGAKSAAALALRTDLETYIE